MAFFALLWKARIIEKYRINYEKEKINSIVMGNTQMEQTLSQRWRHYRYDTQKRISRTFKKWYPDGSGVANLFLYLKTDQTFPNFLLKSMMGFFGGIILTYLCFMFFVFQLSISLIHATIMSSIIGVLLTLGLAFSYRIRCLVFLLIPQFFSRVGRYTLTCYALVLILTGPATNTLKNSEVLSESMACTQEQIKTSVHQLDDLMKKPQNSMKFAIKLMMDRYNVMTRHVKRMIVTLNRLVLSIVGYIHSSFSWLQSISNICNESLGSPYLRCTELLEDRIEDCRNLFGSHYSKYYNMAYLAPLVCAAVKPFSNYCYVTDIMDEAIMASVRKKLKNFAAQIRALFYVEVHIRHSYSFNNNSTRTASQVAAGIVTEIRNRTGPLLTWLSWSSCVTSLFLLLIIFRAKYYQHMYETRPRFDNRYMTKELQELDLKRQRQGRQTVLPLNRRERAKYITASSFHLVTSEKIYLTRSAVFMAITTFKLLIHMVADYSLYWVLMNIRYHGKYQSNVMPGVSQTGAYVSGKGFVARLFRSIVNTLNIPLSQPPPSPLPCLPDPYPPDFRRYIQIGVLIFLLWFFALFEPYGLRLRHLIMGEYRPERAKARASWLYNHILRTRAGFMKFARKKLHREYKYSTESKLTFANWLNDHIPFQCLKCLLGISPQVPRCVLCGATSSALDDDITLTKCEIPDCPGVYCTDCFSDIGQLCTICLSPEDYGDLSDVSLETGSSDDSDSEPFIETVTRDSNPRRTVHVQINDLLPPPTRSAGTRRWRYFQNSFRPEAEDGVLLMQSVDCEDQYFFSHHIHKERVNLYQNIKVRNRSRYESTPKTNKQTSNCHHHSPYCNKNISNISRRDFDSNTVTQQSIGIMTNRRQSILNVILNRLVQLANGSKLSKCSIPQKIKRITKDKQTNTVITKDNGDSNTICAKSTSVSNFYNIEPIQNSGDVKRRTSSHRNIQRNKLKGIMKAVKFLEPNNNQLDSCKNDKDDSTQKTQNSELNNKKNDSSNNTAQKQNYSKKKTIKKSTDGDKTKKPCKEKVKRVRIKTSRHRMRAFHKLFSKYWKNIKVSIDFRGKSNTKVVTAAQRDKKRHKRKKKRTDRITLDKLKMKANKARMDNKRARNYRISVFLADHDWMKWDYKRTSRTYRGTDDTCRVTRPASCSRLAGMKNNVGMKTNKVVAMVQLTSKPFQWQDSKRAGYKESFHIRASGTDSSCRNSANENTKKALERFRKKVNTSFVQRMLSTMNMGRKYSVYGDSSLCLSKRASFYRAFQDELLNRDKSEPIETDVLFKNEDYEDDGIPLGSNMAMSDLTIRTGNNCPTPVKGNNCSTPVNKPYTSNNSVHPFGEKGTVMDIRTCTCRDAAISRETTPAVKSDTSKKKQKSLKGALKNMYTSLLGSSCNDKSCRYRNEQMEKYRLCNDDIDVTDSNTTTRECQPKPKKEKSKRTKSKTSTEKCKTKKAKPPAPAPPPPPPPPPPKSKSFNCSKPTPNPKPTGCPPCCARAVHPRPICSRSPPPPRKSPPPPRKSPSPRKPKSPSISRENSETSRSSSTDTSCREKCSSLLGVGGQIDRSVYKNIELAKIKEIQRHIQREREIENEIKKEQERHRLKEIEIEKELGLELALHRAKEKHLMCDDNSQTEKFCATTWSDSEPILIRSEESCESTTNNYNNDAAVDRVSITTNNCEPEQASSFVKFTNIIKKKMAKSVCCKAPTCDANVGSDRNDTCTCATQNSRTITCANASCVASRNSLGFQSVSTAVPPPAHQSAPWSYPKDSSDSTMRKSQLKNTMVHAEVSPIQSKCCIAAKTLTPEKHAIYSKNSPYRDRRLKNASVLAIHTLDQKLSPCKFKKPSFLAMQTPVRDEVPCRLQDTLVPAMHSPPRKESPTRFRDTSILAIETPVREETKCLLRDMSILATQTPVREEPECFLKNTSVLATLSPICVDAQCHVKDTSMLALQTPVRDEPPCRLVDTGIYVDSPERDQYSCQFKNISVLAVNEPMHNHLKDTLNFGAGTPELLPSKPQAPNKDMSNVAKFSSPAKSNAARCKDVSIIAMESDLLLNGVKNKSISAVKSPDRDKSSCRHRDISILSKNSRHRDKSPFRKNCAIVDKHLATREKAPSRLKDMAVVAKRSSNKTHFRFKDMSILAKFSTHKKSSSRVKHFSTLTTISSPVDVFWKPTTKYAHAPEYNNQSTSNIIVNALSRDGYVYKRYENGQLKDDRRVNRQDVRGTHCNYYWRKKGKRDSGFAKRRMVSLQKKYFGVGNESMSNDITDSNTDSSHSMYSFQSEEGTKTDTTVCSLTTVDYYKRPRNKKYRLKVVTKANQATSTEKASLIDKASITYDWWSPMADKKDNLVLEKKRGHDILEGHRRSMLDCNDNKIINSRTAVTTDPRNVKFNSRTQIIPTRVLGFNNNDLMSPSRYLIESQNYYNELYGYNVRAPVTFIYINDRETTRFTNGAYSRRAKRLDECYSARRQSISSRRNTDSTISCKPPQRRPYIYRKVGRHYFYSGRRCFYGNK